MLDDLDDTAGDSSRLPETRVPKHKLVGKKISTNAAREVERLHSKADLDMGFLHVLPSSSAYSTLFSLWAND